MLLRTTFLCAILVACASIAVADCEWPDEKDPVRVTLVVILASEKGSTIDKRLEKVAPEIQKLHPKLKSFAWHSQEVKTIKPDEKMAMLCVEEMTVEITVKHGADKDNKVTLMVKPPNMSPIEYQSVCGKFLPIVTPYKTKKKETLILAIRVEPCKGK